MPFAPARADIPAVAPPLLSPKEVDALSRAAGLRLDAYRPDHVADRVTRSLERESVGSASELAATLTRFPDARARFRRGVAISVTGRFRDPEQFVLLRERILPELLASEGRPRVWSAGCSSGLELYGVADLLESLGALGRARVLGTDLLDENIAVARAGGGDGVPRTGAVTATMRWETRDLLDGTAVPARYGLVLCRNVGIYLTPEARHELISTVVGALEPGGVLMLGRSERLTDPARYGVEPYLPHAYRRPR